MDDHQGHDFPPLRGFLGVRWLTKMLYLTPSRYEATTGPANASVYSAMLAVLGEEGVQLGQQAHRARVDASAGLLDDLIRLQQQ
jgi:hypothetical protein